MACGAKGGDVLAYLMELYGYDFATAAKLLGAWNERAPNRDVGRPRTLAARDAMALCAFEMNVALLVIGDVRRGIVPADTDWLRFLDAVDRIQHLAVEYSR
jgi:hypothetical protein